MKIISHDNQADHGRRLGRPFPLRVISLVIIGSLTLAILNFTVFTTTPKAHAASWTQVWGDDFNGGAGSAPNGANWLYDLGTSYPGGAGNWGTGEVESNTNSTNNVYLDGNGNLAIKPIRDGNGNWTSGRIETQNTSFAAPAGGEMAIEASIQMPNVTGAAAAGYWPAFWALGSSFRGVYTNWPIAGEIDVMENINGLNTEFGTLHCGVDPGGPCNETTGLGGNTPCSGTTCQGGFHTYRVEVDRSTSPEQLRWYVDGRQFWQVSSNNPGMDATTWANAVDHSFFIILNVAMGGAFPAAFGGGPTGATQSGVPMLVDYVHVFTSGGGGPPPTGYDYIKNRNSGQVLDDTGWSTTAGTAIDQWTLGSGQANQQWALVPTGDGYYYIQNHFSGQVLDDTGWSTTAGTTIEQWTLGSGQANQEWSLVPTGDGYYYIQNRYSGQVLDDTGWSTTAGTTIEQWTLGSGQANQEWSLIGA